MAGNLIACVKTRLKRANSIDDYAPLNADGDDDLLVAEPAAVNWNIIQERLDASGRIGIKEAKEVTDLKACDFFVAEFDFSKGTPLYAARRLPEKLSAQRLKFDQWLFKGGKLDAVDEGRVFNVTLGVDFLIWDGHVFVAEKKIFESIMNIREGMTRKRDEMLTELGGLNRFDGLDHLRTAIGDNAHMLRRATQVADARNWSDPQFLNDLFAVVTKYPEWGIQVSGGKIIVTPENGSGVLSLLNDARVESFIRHHIFDAVIKKPI